MKILSKPVILSSLIITCFHFKLEISCIFPSSINFDIIMKLLNDLTCVVFRAYEIHQCRKCI